MFSAAHGALDYYFTYEHIWSKVHEDSDLVTMGMTYHRRHDLGVIVELELPEVGQTMEQGEIIGVVQSLNDLMFIQAPFSGKVTCINEEVVKNPRIMDQYTSAVLPDDEIWWIEMKTSNLEEEKKNLLSLDQRLLYMAGIGVFDDFQIPEKFL
ncbi:glycine cleavage system H protein-like isoform X2 [Convolutriloba macropyga]|uniref:glycine cleavage system H protein-like isoform X2 n=1 Tax=Convolutriloba macropyga TaxID=536237 RepID=UPI003F51C2BB